VCFVLVDDNCDDGPPGLFTTQQSEAMSTKDCRGRCQDQTLLVWVKMTLTSESPCCLCAAGALGMLHRKGIGHFCYATAQPGDSATLLINDASG
jgi:hypothetical protein